MVDFLKAAKRSAEEVITVAGVEVTVRGLSIKTLQALTKVNEKDPESLTTELIVACCFDKTGKPLIQNERKDELGEVSPAVFKALADAVSRVNGAEPGNSNATDGDGSSSV